MANTRDFQHSFLCLQDITFLLLNFWTIIELVCLETDITIRARDEPWRARMSLRDKVLVLVCIAQDVVEVCSSEVIADVDLSHFKLGFDRKLLGVRKGRWCR